MAAGAGALVVAGAGVAVAGAGTVITGAGAVASSPLAAVATSGRCWSCCCCRCKDCCYF